MATLIGLTGQTGAGKSSVREIFRDSGAAVIDADSVAHEITEDNLDCLFEIVDKFSCLVLNESGKLNRRALGRMVFSDKAKLATLNKIMFPYIVKSIKTKATALYDAGAEIVVVDGATLIESGFAKLCDSLVSVTAEPEIRQRRIVSRDGISEADAKRRILSQNGDEFYSAASDYIIENSGSKDELFEQAQDVFRKISERKREAAMDKN